MINPMMRITWRGALRLVPGVLYVALFGCCLATALTHPSGLGYEFIPLVYFGFPVSFLAIGTPGLLGAAFLVLGPIVNVVLLYFLGDVLVDLCSRSKPLSIGPRTDGE
jgi:hypothetical protein